MPFVIADPCVDVTDRSCMQQCPVDCIYQGGHALYINPAECIDCGSCEPACPVGAVYDVVLLPGEYGGAAASNEQFFQTVIAGRETPLGQPGGASTVGPLGYDTPYVLALAEAKAATA